MTFDIDIEKMFVQTIFDHFLSNNSDHHLPLKKRALKSSSSISSPFSSPPSTPPPSSFGRDESFCSFQLASPSSSTVSETFSFDSGFGDVEPLDLSTKSSLRSLHANGLKTINQDANSHHFNESVVGKPQLIPKSFEEATNNCGLSDNNDKLVCPQCDKIYESNARFRAHIRRHESKQSGRYQCKICHKNFVQRSSLRTHERIHTGEKPYHCSVCNERFGDFSTFTKHRRIHTGEKPYACPVCDRCFSQSGNMHRHLKILHRPRPNLYRL